MTRSFRFGSIALACLVELALFTIASAQPGGFGGPGRGPGFGGFSFGMPGGESRSAPSAQYDRLLNAPTVQKELNLTEDQTNKIKEIKEKGRDATRELFSGMRDLKEDERKAKMEEAGKKMQAQSEATTKAVEAELLPTQLQRLRQLALQAAGIDALNDKQVQQELKLAEEQIAAINVVGKQSSKKMREMFTPGGDFQSIGPKTEEARKEKEKRILALLTESQLAALEKMKGTKLEIPESELRGSRGGRTRGGSGGPGGRGGPGGGSDGPGGGSDRQGKGSPGGDRRE